MSAAERPPVEGTGTQIWSSSDWREQAVAWLDEQLAAAGMSRTGDVDQPHNRPWATALRAPTERGNVWLKAAGPGTAFEIALYGLLHRITPDRVLTPIAIDVARGWIVLPDGGPTLGDSCRGIDLASAMVHILPEYARLQRDLAPHCEELLALGVVDMRSTCMPGRFEEALAVVGDYVDRSGSADERVTYKRVSAARDTFGAWCAELGRAPGAPSLDHNDLHPWNIFSTGGAAHAKFYDWGDSVVAHPFASLLAALGRLCDELHVGAGDPQILQVRDAYLEVFGDLAPHAELVHTLELACRVSKAARALVWVRALRTLSAEDAPHYARAPYRWLSSVLDESHLGNGG